jgi:hypothetical protein
MTPTREDQAAADEIVARCFEFVFEGPEFDRATCAEIVTRHRLAAEERGARMALERAAKVARAYAAKAKQRGWPMFPDSIEKAARHIATTIRQIDPAALGAE